jgi:hypothetical protein
MQSGQHGDYSHSKLAVATDKLRHDFLESQKVIEEKNAAISKIKSEYSEVVSRLRVSREKHIKFEESYRKTILNAIHYLEV